MRKKEECDARNSSHNVERMSSEKKLQVQSRFPRPTLRRYFVHVFVILIGVIIHARLLLPLEDSQQFVSGFEEFALLPHHTFALLQLQLLLSQAGFQLFILLYDLGQAVSQVADLLFQVDHVESRLAVLLGFRVKVMLNLGQLIIQFISLPFPAIFVSEIWVILVGSKKGNGRRKK